MKKLNLSVDINISPYQNNLIDDIFQYIFTLEPKNLVFFPQNTVIENSDEKDEGIFRRIAETENGIFISKPMLDKNNENGGVEPKQLKQILENYYERTIKQKTENTDISKEKMEEFIKEIEPFSYFTPIKTNNLNRELLGPLINPVDKKYVHNIKGQPFVVRGYLRGEEFFGMDNYKLIAAQVRAPIYLPESLDTKNNLDLGEKIAKNNKMTFTNSDENLTVKELIYTTHEIAPNILTNMYKDLMIVHSAISNAYEDYAKHIKKFYATFAQEAIEKIEKEKASLTAEKILKRYINK